MAEGRISALGGVGVAVAAGMGCRLGLGEGLRVGKGCVCGKGLVTGGKTGVWMAIGLAGEVGVGCTLGCKPTTSIGSLTSGNSLAAKLGYLGMGVSSGCNWVWGLLAAGWGFVVVGDELPLNNLLKFN